MVTRPSEYREMVDSFVSHGFSPDDTEFLWVDNTSTNKIDAFSAYNLFLSEAKSPYIILCHQDVALLSDGRTRLDEIIQNLNRIDPRWGLFGNAGVTQDGVLTLHITDPYGTDRALGYPLPARVVSLDENFIGVRRQANLALSHDLKGFHAYGSDLCVIADILGLNAYVVDFHLHHKSAGRMDAGFYQSLFQLKRKYDRAFRSRHLHFPTRTSVFLSGSPILRTTVAASRQMRRKWAQMKGKVMNQMRRRILR